MGKDKTDKSSQSPNSGEKEKRKSRSHGSSSEPRHSRSKDSSSEPGSSKDREPIRSAANESTAGETSALASQMSTLPPIPKLLIRGVSSMPPTGPADSSGQMERMAAAVETNSKQMSELMSCMGTFIASMAPKVPKRKAEEPAEPDVNDWAEEDEGEYHSDSKSEREEPQEEESELGLALPCMSQGRPS